MAYVICNKTSTLKANMKPMDIANFFGRESSVACNHTFRQFEQAAATNINEAFGLLQNDRESYWYLFQKFALTFAPENPGM